MRMTIPATFAIVALLSLTSPLASASASYNDTLPYRVSAVTGPALFDSNPALQSARVYNVVLQKGDSVSASAAWTSTASGPVANDIDLTLYLPSGAPIPLPLPPSQQSLLAFVNSRQARETCSDTAASSHNHQLTGGPASEALSFTVPTGGETGTYTLLVRGFLLTADQPYTAGLTVTDASGADITASRVAQSPSLTVFITTAPNCQLP